MKRRVRRGLFQDFLNENCPEDKKDDIDYIFSLLDWERTSIPITASHFRPPITIDSAPDGCIEKWVVYANDYVGAKELTVLPGQEVTITDGAAYGLILTQGHGTLGVHECERHAAALGQLSQDEFYVTETAAKNGVRIRNTSRVEPLVMLKHFGPNHPDMPRTKE